jgi:hypothetical protein
MIEERAQRSLASLVFAELDKPEAMRFTQGYRAWGKV